MLVLTVNAGSSSIRLAAWEAAQGELRRLAAHHREAHADHAGVLQAFLGGLGGRRPDAVVHRIVHGGQSLVESTLIDGPVEARIESLAALAPLHTPVALAWLRASRTALGPQVPHIAVFDTAFYADLPAVARHYALPRELTERLHLRRYGFHGLAHQAMVRRWRRLQPAASADARVISLQLGAGCSITATRGGRPVDTSMGFSPLEGLVMATRSGDVDPGLLLHLQRTTGRSAQDMQELLNDRSGLLGLSGSSADMRVLLDSSDPAARLAVELYCYRALKYVGAYLAVLGGADAVLFGGGVGENAAPVRERILAGFGWAGITIDVEANRRASGVETCISPAAAGTEVWTIPVDETRILAEQALAVLDSRAHGGHQHG